MKIAIYCRVSTDDQNIGQQREVLVDYCKRNGWSYRSYADSGVSGEVSDRPEWLKLLRDCERGLFEAILVVKYDRITRDLRYALEFLEWLGDRKDLALISVYDGSFDLSPDKIFTFKLKCLLSEYELAVLRWRSRIGIDRAKAEGKYKGGKPGRTWNR